MWGYNGFQIDLEIHRASEKQNHTPVSSGSVGKERIIMKKTITVLLALCMVVSLLSVGALASGEASGAMGMPGGGSRTYTEGGAANELESTTYTDIVFAESTGDNEAGLRAGEGVVAVIDNATIVKSAGDLSGDDASFYGTNSGVHSYEDGNITISNSTITTNATGANGVFAYGDSTITITDSVVDTDGRASGGIMVAGGGTLYAENLYVTTEGGSSAAIRSDRGSGLMVINGGSYISNGTLGTGSPAVYCVADITVSNATLVAKNAQSFCFEGRNPGKVYNCYLEGNYTASDDDEASNVMVYQSMSGDSEEGTSYFTMVGGVMKAVNSNDLANYKMFYTTNTYCYISLYDVEMIYPETYYAFLMCACNTNQRGWGTAGANGSECVLYCIDQEFMGDIIFDTWSYLDCYLTDGTVATTAFVQREDNGERGCSVYLDAESQIILTADSTVQNLYTGGSIIVDEAGAAVSVVGADGTVYVQGDSALTITVTGAYGEEDLTAQENVANIGTETNYTFDPEAIAAEYIDASYIPADEAGNTYDSHNFAAEADTSAEPAAEEAASAEMNLEDGSLPPDPPADLAPGEEPPGGFGGID